MEMADSFWFLESGLILFNRGHSCISGLLIEIVFHWTSGCKNILSDWITQTESCTVTKQACEDRDSTFVGSLSQFSVETFHLSEQLSASNWPLSSTPTSIRTKYHNNNTITHGVFFSPCNHKSEANPNKSRSRFKMRMSPWKKIQAVLYVVSLICFMKPVHAAPQTATCGGTKADVIDSLVNYVRWTEFFLFFSYRQKETTRQSKRREEKSNSVWTER